MKFKFFVTFFLAICFAALSGAGCNSGNRAPVPSASRELPLPEDALVPATIYTFEELEGHSTPDDCWIVIDGTVYDVTGFIPGHPGGEEAITRWCGQDASAGFSTKNFSGQSHDAASKLKLDPYFIGVISN